MAFTQRQAEIRNQILTALADTPEGKIIAPYVMRQLRQRCNFASDVASWEIEAVLEKMVKARQIIFMRSPLTIGEIALTDPKKRSFKLGPS